MKSNIIFGPTLFSYEELVLMWIYIWFRHLCSFILLALVYYRILLLWFAPFIFILTWKYWIILVLTVSCYVYMSLRKKNIFSFILGNSYECTSWFTTFHKFNDKFSNLIENLDLMNKCNHVMTFLVVFCWNLILCFFNVYFDIFRIYQQESCQFPRVVEEMFAS